MKHNKYYHTFSDILNFSDELQGAMDNIVKYTSEFYIKSKKSAIICPCNSTNFYELKEQKSIKYLEYGITLIQGGIMPDLLEILMENIYEIIIDNCDENELKLLRLQLLFIKKSVKLFHTGNLKDYFFLCQQIVSNEVNINEYKKFF